MLKFFIHLYPFVFKHFGKIHSTDASFGIAFPMHIHLWLLHQQSKGTATKKLICLHLQATFGKMLQHSVYHSYSAYATCQV